MPPNDRRRARGTRELPVSSKGLVAACLGEEERRELEGHHVFVMTPGWCQHWREIFRESLHRDEVGAAGTSTAPQDPVQRVAPLPGRRLRLL